MTTQQTDLELKPQKNISARLVIYPKDVQIITGKAYRTACTLLQEIRKAHNKSRLQFVTIREFALHTGIEEDLIREFLAD